MSSEKIKVFLKFADCHFLKKKGGAFTRSCAGRILFFNTTVIIYIFIYIYKFIIKYIFIYIFIYIVQMGANVCKCMQLYAIALFFVKV